VTNCHCTKPYGAGPVMTLASSAGPSIRFVGERPDAAKRRFTSKGTSQVGLLVEPRVVVIQSGQHEQVRRRSQA